MDSLRFDRPAAPLKVPDSDPGTVPTVTSLPGAPGLGGTGRRAGTPGPAGATFPGSASQTPGNWASAAVPVIVKPVSAGAQAGAASFSANGARVGDIVIPVAAAAAPAPQPAAPLPDRAPVAPGSATATAATPATPATPATLGVTDRGSATAAAAANAAIPATSATPAAPTAPAASAAATATANATADTAAAVADPVRLMPHVVRHGGPSFASAYSPGGSASAVDRSTAVAPVAGAVSNSAAGSDGAGTGPQPDTTGNSAAALAPGTPAAGSIAGSTTAASMVAGAAAVAAPASSASQTDSAIGVRQAVDLADAADRLMSQAVQTIHAYQTSAGPSLETRISDPSLGDVRVIVTGRAGEIVQAQLVVHDRVAADAIAAAASRMHASGDALAGVTLTVRSEGGGSTTNGRAGGNAFESTGWAAGNGYGAAANSGSGSGGRDQGLANQNAALSGNGSGGQSQGGDSSREAPRPPVALPPATPRPLTRTPLKGGPSLDVRA
jgi:hypothetical protein